MAKNILGQAALWAIIMELIKSAAKYFGKKAGEVNAEEMKEMLISNPRILVDYLIDQLKYGVKDFSENDIVTAEKRWKKHWIPRATNTSKPCSKNKLFTILCGILELDKDPKSNLYDMEFPIAKRRLVELGLKEDVDFDQSINNMIDNPVHEFFDHFSKQSFTTVKNLSDEAKKKIEKGFGVSFDKIKNGIAWVRNAFHIDARVMKKWQKVLAVIAILVIFIVLSVILVWIFAQIWLFDLFFESFDTLADITGINKYLIQVAMAIFFIPFLLGATYVLSTNKIKRRIGIILLASLFVIYNLSLFLLSKDFYFDKQGKAIKYYALTPDGIVYSDQSGVDRVYGIKYKPVTPEIIRNHKLRETGDFTPVDPQKAVWFNPITGDPQLWYYRHPEKSFDFFNKPGYHPTTGEELQPVSKEVYFAWKEYSESIKDKSVVKMKEVEKTDKKNNHKISERISSIDTFNELDEFNSTLNREIILDKNTKNVALAIKITDKKFSSIERGFANQVKVENLNFLNTYFKESFYTNGYFNNIYSGNADLLKKAGVFDQLNYVILGKLKYSFRKSTISNEDIISCDINFSYKILNTSAAIISADNISAVGPGFAEEQALKKSIEILSEKFSETLKGNL